MGQKRIASELSLHALAAALVQNAILITGSARSGTTMMGSLLHSLEATEYAFEPPFLFGLFPLVGHMPRQRWCFLFEAYLFEDVYLETLAGRRLNLNRHDASSVYLAKSDKLVDDRLSRSWSRSMLLEVATERRLVYKMPDILPYLPRVRQFYPKQTIVAMFRGLLGTVGSLLEKEWFSDRGLEGFTSIWPGRGSQDGVPVPHWVPIELSKEWIGMDHVERCYYYYTRMYEAIEDLEGALVVDYDQFVTEPRKTFRLLTEVIGAEFGEKTEDLLQNVYRRTRYGDRDLASRGSRHRQRAVEVEERVRAMMDGRGVATIAGS